MTNPTVAPEDRLRAPQSCQRRLSLLLGAAATVTACASAPARPAADHAPLPQPSPTTSASASAWHPGPGQSVIAVAKRRTVTVVSATDPHRRWRLANPNSSGADLTFLVVGSSATEWKVRVPARPNGAIGWVAAADVDLQVDDYALAVSLRAHTLSVYRDNVLVHRFAVGLGSPAAPTPKGHFFLTELLKAADPHGPYGPYAYGTSAFSNVFSEFEGGPGQIGVHGTNDPRSIGRNVSHGCIRLRLADITELAHEVPAGTPLTISD